MLPYRVGKPLIHLVIYLGDFSAKKFLRGNLRGCFTPKLPHPDFRNTYLADFRTTYCYYDLFRFGRKIVCVTSSHKGGDSA
jgi:hypothetical protein